jgi:uncharacterized protein (DUF2062 family)
MRKLGFKRFVKLKYLLLLRSPGGAKMIAKGFSIGLAVEFITLITFGLAFFLIFPLLKLLKGSLPSAMIGFLFGKLILPLFLPIGIMLGETVFGFETHIKYTLPFGKVIDLADYLNTFLGMLCLGTIMGLLAYYPIYFATLKYQQARLEKRKQKAEDAETKPSEVEPI